MPQRYNASYNHVRPQHIVGHDKDGAPLWQSVRDRAVAPGDGEEFTDEEIAAGLGAEWVEDDPRAGLADELEWKAERDARSIGKRPPLTGPGSGVGAWRAFAEHSGIAVPADASKAEIIAAVEASEQSDTTGESAPPADTTSPAESGEHEEA